MPDVILPPSPKSHPFIGSLLELEPDAVIQGLTRMWREHGPIYRLSVLGQVTTVLGGQQLVAEVCDESRFGKYLHSALLNLRPALGDGLFTARGDEPNWALAHGILMPAFGPIGIRGMADKMLDIAGQMFDRWERFGDEAEIDVPDMMTRLTLDTLALCAFDYRFNSFYRDDMHPFVDAMVGALVEAGARDRRPDFISRSMLRTRRRFERDVMIMHDLADTLLAARRGEARKSERGDLLDAMLSGVDPVTGRGLDDENIRYQLVTFLIAGHETTSGLLSFATYLLLRHPDVLREAQNQVDDLLGGRDPTIDDLAELRIIERILMESLRLWPTAPGFAVTPHEPTLIAGRYAVEPGNEILVLLPALHRDPLVWGADADAFRPDRFAGNRPENLPPHAWKPFGNGQRACIGRGFAMQEAQLVLTMMLQRFDISLARPDYALRIAETLTLKPDGLHIRARRRRPRVSAPVPVPAVVPAPEAGEAPRPDAAPLLVLHGGNAGSSEAFARQIAVGAAARGFRPRLASLDAATSALRPDEPVIIVTASYEGLPADNARRFITWLDTLGEAELTGVRYAVLGCGNRQWARTYQAVPTHVDAALARGGAARLLTRGEADASGDFLRAAERWIEQLWAALGAEPAERQHPPAALRLESLPSPRAAPGFAAARCVGNELLTCDGLDLANRKRHLELELPQGASYRPGDHLSVLPANPPANVARALRLLGCEPHERFVVRESGERPLPVPVDIPMTVEEFLSDCVELEQPASPDLIHMLAERTQCSAERGRLETLLARGLSENADGLSRPGALSLIESLTACRVGVDDLLLHLPPMRPRRYSIASSDRAEGRRCALTLSVVDAPVAGGSGRHLGVASNHLAGLAVGASLLVQVQPGPPAFRLPEAPETPIVMIAAGSGIAPFRGFVEDRALAAAAGAGIGRALLFAGFRHPDHDYLYRDSFAAWQKAGAVELRPCFSRLSDAGPRYVQDRLDREAAEVAALIARGAHVYVCGDASRLVPAVERALAPIVALALGLDADRAVSCLAEQGRYAVDAFA